MKRWMLAALVITAPVLGCVERLADSDEEPRFPACATITATGYWEDGSQRVLYDERDGAAGTACVCLSWPEKLSHDWDEEINDLAFAECTRLADVYSGNSTGTTVKNGISLENGSIVSPSPSTTRHRERAGSSAAATPPRDARSRANGCREHSSAAP